MIKYIILFISVYIIYNYYNKITQALKKAAPHQPLQNQKKQEHKPQNEDEYIDYEEVE